MNPWPRPGRRGAIAWLIAGLFSCAPALGVGPAPSPAGALRLVAADWEPFTSRTLFDGGFLTEIAVQALIRVGYQPTVEILPWSRALNGAREGTYDGLIGASFTRERMRYFQYPQFGFDGDIYLFTLADRFGDHERLEELCPARVGVLRGSFLADVLGKTPCLRQEPGKDVLTNVRKLAWGRIDLLAETTATVEFHMRREMPGKLASIRKLEPALVRDRVYLAFSKRLANHEEIARDYDRGIGLIEADGTLRAILEKYGISSSAGR